MSDPRRRSARKGVGRVKKDGAFRKSKSSGFGNCVEVAAFEDEFRMRDSKTGPGGAVLAFPAAVWLEFAEGVKEGHFNPPGR